MDPLFLFNGASRREKAREREREGEIKRENAAALLFLCGAFHQKKSVFSRGAIRERKRGCDCVCVLLSASFFVLTLLVRVVLALSLSFFFVTLDLPFARRAFYPLAFSKSSPTPFRSQPSPGGGL